MKCEEMDLIGYLDGITSKDANCHIESCRKCTKELEKMRLFMTDLLPAYAAGKSLEQELNKTLQSINHRKMEPLPDTLAQKILQHKEKSLASKLKKVIGEGTKNAKAFLDEMLSPRLHAMPASPKDIAGTKKKKKQIKKKNK